MVRLLPRMSPAAKHGASLGAPHLLCHCEKVGLAQLYAQQGKWEAAVDAYKKAVELEPRNVIAWTNLGSALVERSQEAKSSDVSVTCEQSHEMPR